MTQPVKRARGEALLSFAFAIAIFIALPQALAKGFFWLISSDMTIQDPRFHLTVGLFKLSVFFGYIVLVSRIPEMRRVFQYHGAEHKTISAYEAGLPLTLENVRAQSTLHPRCGTTFMVVVIFVSILVSAFVTPLVLPNASGAIGQVLTFVLRVLLLPLIAAFSYELQRVMARYCTTGPLRVLLWPGFLFQKITTREPDDQQIEVAIAAMQAAVWREEAGNQASPATRSFVFSDLAAFARAGASFKNSAPDGSSAIAAE